LTEMRRLRSPFSVSILFVRYINSRILVKSIPGEPIRELRYAQENRGIGNAS
jgi:hypothetical protein